MRLTKLFRIFFISLSLTFLMSVIPHLNIKHNFISPLSPKDIILEKIKPKLDKPDDFQLNNQLIPLVSAGADYDLASAYGVVDMDTGQVLTAKNLSEKLPMASLTKIMTAVVALDLADPGDEFTVSENASLQAPTKVMLRPGEKYSLNNLLEQMLISSANDSAVVIQEGVDKKYGQNVFIRAMNLKAQNLGLKNTHFINPAGLDSPEQFSSVEDLSVLSHYALKNYPLIKEIVAKEFEDLTKDKDFRFYLNNWNGLLGVYPGVAGVKIGNTEKAGVCTIVVSEREGKKVLAVLLGAPGVLERDFWAAELLDLGFSKMGLAPVNITKDQLKAKYSSWKYF